MRVMWCDRDPDSRKSGKGNVYAKNLSESIDNIALQHLFGKFGTILSSKVATFEDGKSKGHGFVQFGSEDSANSAIEKLNGSIFGDKQIYVGKFIKKNDRVFPSPDAKYTNLYVKNLDAGITEELLQEKFSEFGKIVSLTIAKNADGTSKGFGFINFDNPDDARWAMERMNGAELGSKVLYVGRAQKKAEREQILHRQFEEKREEQITKYKGSNVYVKNIDDDVTDEELREQFGRCGTITSSKLMKDDKGRNKGFGFVCFSNSEEANKAVNTFHGQMFHRKPLYVAIAQRKEDRQAQLQLQYAQRIAGLGGPSGAIISGGYPSLYYTSPGGVVAQVPPQVGMMYQPLRMHPGWRGNGIAPPSRPASQPSQLPVMPNGQRQNKQTRGRVNGNVFPQGGTHSVSYIQQPIQPPTTSLKNLSNQRTGQTKYVPNGRICETSKGSGISAAVSPSNGPLPRGSEALTTMLASATPDERKQILGERLYPLIQKQKPDLVAKITGMLLEMDNSELLLLLESPVSLTAKVEEAVQVLKISKTKVSGRPSYLSAEVAVN